MRGEYRAGHPAPAHRPRPHRRAARRGLRPHRRAPVPELHPVGALLLPRGQHGALPGHIAGAAAVRTLVVAWAGPAPRTPPPDPEDGALPARAPREDLRLG